MKTLRLLIEELKAPFAQLTKNEQKKFKHFIAALVATLIAAATGNIFLLLIAIVMLAYTGNGLKIIDNKKFQD